MGRVKLFENLRIYDLRINYARLRGFEPLISSVTGRRVKPLRYSPKTWLNYTSIKSIEQAPKPKQAATVKNERAVYYLLSSYGYTEWYGGQKTHTYLAVETGMAERRVNGVEWVHLDTRYPREMWGRNPKYLTETDRKLIGIIANAERKVGYDRFHDYSAVGIDEISIQEVLRLAKTCPLASWKKPDKNGKPVLTPLSIIERAKLEIVLQHSVEGWKLQPKIDGNEREIATVFDYEIGLLLTSLDELVILTHKINSDVLKLVLAEKPIADEVLRQPKTLLTLMGLTRYVPMTLPAELVDSIATGSPKPRVQLSMITRTSWESRVQMEYGRIAVSPTEKEREYLSDGTGKIVKRDWEKEVELVREFEKYKREIYLPEDVTTLADILPPEWEIWMEEGVLSRAPGKMNFTSESSIDWLGIDGELEINEEKYSLAELILAGAGRTRMVNLRGKRHLVDSQLFTQLQKLDPLADSSGLVQLNRTQVGLLENLEMIEVDKLHGEWRKTLRSINDFTSIGKIQGVKEISAPLRPYQLLGVGFLRYLQEMGFGGILADDMGLGKTVQTLAILAQYFAKNKKLKALIVAPTSVVSNWESEIVHFCPQLTTLNYTGPIRTLPKRQYPQIVLTNYAILRIDSEKLKKEKWDYVILDEAQYAKNVKSQTARVARELTSTHRLCLTGTPIENNLSELYSQLTFLNPGMLGALEQFRQKIAIPIEKHQDVYVSTHLQRLIKPFILRRTKEQVLKDLPPKTEQVITLPMGAEQRQFYETLRDYYRAKVMKLVEQRGVERSQIQILEALLRLRQACCDPRLVKANDKSGSVKLDELGRMARELIGEGHKVLVFSQFTGMIELIEKQLTKEKLPYQTLTGQTKASERKRLRDHFQTSPTPLIFLLSLKAGGVGVNLTAASYVIHFDPWWNPAVEAQATDRAHRIGQHKSVSVYKMLIKDSIEEKIKIYVLLKVTFSPF